MWEGRGVCVGLGVWLGLGVAVSTVPAVAVGATGMFEGRKLAVRLGMGVLLGRGVAVLVAVDPVTGIFGRWAAVGPGRGAGRSGRGCGDYVTKTAECTIIKEG